MLICGDVIFLFRLHWICILRRTQFPHLLTLAKAEREFDDGVGEGVVGNLVQMNLMHLVDGQICEEFDTWVVVGSFC